MLQSTKTCAKDSRPSLLAGRGRHWSVLANVPGQIKDSLWSMDLFRCESVTLRTHWVLVVMDQYRRRIIGFGAHAGTVDGVALYRMFNRDIRGQRWLPKYLSSDHDPLYVPPMASQSADPGCERNQNRPLRSPASSLRGKP